MIETTCLVACWMIMSWSFRDKPLSIALKVKSRPLWAWRVERVSAADLTFCRDSKSLRQMVSKVVHISLTIWMSMALDSCTGGGQGLLWLALAGGSINILKEGKLEATCVKNLPGGWGVLTSRPIVSSISGPWLLVLASGDPASNGWCRSLMSLWDGCIYGLGGQL